MSIFLSERWRFDLFRGTSFNFIFICWVIIFSSDLPIWDLIFRILLFIVIYEFSGVSLSFTAKGADKTDVAPIFLLCQGTLDNVTILWQSSVNLVWTGPVYSKFSREQVWFPAENICSKLKYDSFLSRSSIFWYLATWKLSNAGCNCFIYSFRALTNGWILSAIGSLSVYGMWNCLPYTASLLLRLSRLPFGKLLM